MCPRDPCPITLHPHPVLSRAFPRRPETEGPLLEGRAEVRIIWENGFYL